MMDIRALKAFFGCCTVINGGLLILSTIVFIAAPDFIYNAHAQLFHLPREAFDAVIYGFLGLYKIVILVFNLVPYVALRIVTGK